MPVFLKIFAKICNFLKAFTPPGCHPGLQVCVNPALFLVTPAKECHPSFFFRHPSESRGRPCLSRSFNLVITPDLIQP
jgi:hypothetical protein